MISCNIYTNRKPVMDMDQLQRKNKNEFHFVNTPLRNIVMDVTVKITFPNGNDDRPVRAKITTKQER